MTIQFERESDGEILTFTNCEKRVNNVGYVYYVGFYETYTVVVDSESYYIGNPNHYRSGRILSIT